MTERSKRHHRARVGSAGTVWAGVGEIPRGWDTYTGCQGPAGGGWAEGPLGMGARGSWKQRTAKAGRSEEEEHGMQFSLGASHGLGEERRGVLGGLC